MTYELEPIVSGWHSRCLLAQKGPATHSVLKKETVTAASTTGNT